MLKAIIFDMDGVIVDTEYTEFMLQKEFIEKLKQHNRPITLEQQSETVGKSLNDIPEIIKKLSGTSLSLQQIRQQLCESVRARDKDSRADRRAQRATAHRASAVQVSK